MNDIASYVPAPPPAWVKRFARFGLIAKGIVYCLVGLLAFMAAFKLNGNTSDDASRSGTFNFILDQPFGQVLLALVAIGLLCYCLWRLIQAVRDTDNKGSDAKGIGKRIGYAFSGILYGSFAVLAARMVMSNGGNSGGGGDSRQMLADKLLEQPFGQWLAGAVALGIIGYGLYQFYRGFSDKYRKEVKSAGLQGDTEKLMIRAGKFGYMARGVVLVIIGYLFLKASINANPQEAGGNVSAFKFLQDSSYGSYLLGAVALGLICYGIFMFLRSKYQAVPYAV